MKKKNKEKEMKIDKTVIKTITFLYTIVSVVFFYLIINLGLIPEKYIAIAGGVAIAILLALIKRCKANKKGILDKLFIFIGTLIIIIFSVASFYLNKTTGFFNNMFGANKQIIEYSVLVRTESDKHKIEDVKAQDTIKINKKNNEKVKEALSKVTEAEILVDDQDKFLLEELLSKNDDIIAIPTAIHDIQKEVREDYQNLVREIYKFEIGIEVEGLGRLNKKNEGKYNILISGLDTSGNITNSARSDVNIVLTANMDKNEVLITNIPRDYYVTLPTYGQKDKLTHSGLYGIEETSKAIEELLDIDITHYVLVNFSTLEGLIDAIGGIEVNSDYNFTARNTNYTFKKGINKMDGKKALAFARERYSFKDGDIQRGKNQAKVIEAIMQKALKDKKILTSYLEILDKLEGKIKTNMSKDEMSGVVKRAANVRGDMNVKQQSVIGTGARRATYSGGRQLLSVILPNQEEIKKAHNNIMKVLGEYKEEKTAN